MIENLANDMLGQDLDTVRRVPYCASLAAETTHRHDYVSAYVGELGAVVDFDLSARPNCGWQ